jgi:glycosyltransferase involved in cell wall biosynthesis
MVHMLCRDPRIGREVGDLTGIPTSTLRIGGGVMIQDAARFALELRKHSPDAVVLTTFKKVALAGLGARIARVPRVVQRVGLSGDVPRGPAYRMALRGLVDVIALNAESLRPEFLAGDPRLPPEKVRTILDGVDTPRRSRPPGSFRAELGVPPEAPVVGSVARLASQKRFDRLLRAAASLPEDVHVVIVGEGDERASLLALGAELGLGDRLHLPGFRAEVGDVLDAIDVFAVTSSREGLANAMLEAMAFGVACVSTDVSGAREALGPIDGVEAGVVVGHDLKEITAAIADLLDHPARRSELAEAGRLRFEQRFSLERMLDEWEAMLRG